MEELVWAVVILGISLLYGLYTLGKAIIKAMGNGMDAIIEHQMKAIETYERKTDDLIHQIEQLRLEEMSRERHDRDYS